MLIDPSDPAILGVDRRMIFGKAGDGRSCRKSPPTGSEEPGTKLIDPGTIIDPRRRTVVTPSNGTRIVTTERGCR